jgi:uncharacterized protein (TIGR00255 family)
MTGYGKATCEFPDKRITIEVKSLNSKQLDIFTRVPSMYKEKDIEMRRMMADKLSRGKVEFNLFVESLGETVKSVINQQVFASYLSQMKSVSEATGAPLPQDLFANILRLPDVMKNEVKEFDKGEWETLRSSVSEALDNLNAFRAQEGVSIYSDISGNIEKIEHLLSQVGQYEDVRIEKVRQRIKEGLEALEAKPNMERLEQEMIFYIEKMDLNEEKTRLAHHCKYFIETANLDEPVGKKLGFISQEIGREINTLGSKANHEDIQKLVVHMKDELEKIKEQVLNTL